MDDDGIRDQGIVFEPHRFESGHATYRGLQPAIERLRAVPLPYIGPLIEPASAVAWLEDDGDDDGGDAA